MMLEYLRDDRQKPGFIFNGPKLGGLSKSASIKDIVSLAVLAELKVGIIDADQSSGSLSISLEQSKVSLIKLADRKSISDDIISKYKDFDLIVQDNGATGITDAKIMGPTTKIIQSVGVRNTCLCLNIIPHKDGLNEDVDLVQSIYQWLPKKCIFKVNIDDSDKFDALPDSLLNAPKVEIPHLTASQIEVYTSRKILPAELLQNPPLTQQLVCKQIAWRLLQIALSNNFAKFIGAEAAIPVLRTMSEGAPTHTMPPKYVSDDKALLEYIDFQKQSRMARLAETDKQRVEHLKQSQIHEERFNGLKVLL